MLFNLHASARIAKSASASAVEVVPHPEDINLLCVIILCIFVTLQHAIPMVHRHLL
jgi:hypothetical protein